MRNLHNLILSEIEAIIFEDASVSEPRGLRDRLSDEEILSLVEHPCYSDWPNHFKDWVWSAIDNILEEAA